MAPREEMTTKKDTESPSGAPEQSSHSSTSSTDVEEPTEIHPFGEDDVNLWTQAVPDYTDVEVQLHHMVHPEEHQHQQHQHHAPPAEESSAADENEDDSVSVKEPRSFLRTCIEVFKYTYSTVLLVFCVVVVSAAIFTYQTTATGIYGLHPAAAFPIFWLLLLWLALMEGGLNCMVGLQPIPKALYAQSHPLTTRCTTLAHRGDNIERFIVGRQFMDLLVVFVTNFMVSAIPNAQVLGLPKGVSEAFFDSGLAVILVTIVFGQLASQINAAHSMLDFTNNCAMVAITYLALIVEASGLLHAVYLIQILFAKVTGKPITTNEPPRKMGRKILFWGRVVMSTCILIIALVITFAALFQGQTTMWLSVPPAASTAMLIFLILLTGLMEGLQIAFFAVLHIPTRELEKHPTVQQNCKFVFAGQHLQLFLIGRQVFQTVVMFLIARITTIDSGEQNLFGVSDGMQKFFNTGILGALFSTILASLAWRVLASTFPLAFLANPFAYVIIRLCVLIEKSGVCYSAWLVAALHKKLVGYKLDEEYLGKTEDVLSETGQGSFDLQMTQEGEQHSCSQQDEESSG